MEKVTVFNHPLIMHKLSIMRDENTTTKQFHETTNEITSLMVYEISRNLPTRKTEVKTPVSISVCQTLDKEVVIVPILRAGLGMVEGIRSLIPNAKVGHLGLYRDPETLLPVTYYWNHPEGMEEAIILVVDPMLATGGSAADAISKVKEAGGQNIKFVGMVGCPEGVSKLQEIHPDVEIYLAALDEKLNDHGYIVPGLGDAGDRLFGTK